LNTFEAPYKKKNGSGESPDEEDMFIMRLLSFLKDIYASRNLVI
jgi:hypothetical protein